MSIFIPYGALPEGKKQEIYFKVCQDSKHMPPLDSNSGEFNSFFRYGPKQGVELIPQYRIGEFQIRECTTIIIRIITLHILRE